MPLLVSGSLPPVMAENSGRGDWIGLLRVTSDAGIVAAVEAVGPGASYVALTFSAAAGTLVVEPGARADYEAFLAQALSPAIGFSLRATLTNGQVETSSAFAIPVLDRDDTPPTALGFATGGQVAAGAIGAVIGILRVTDPDTPAGSFLFALPEEEDWRFEIVNGTTLKLRDGISLGLDDIGQKPLLVSVSDGSQWAGFSLGLTVTDPNAPAAPPLLLAAGEARGGLGLPEPDRALVLRDADALVTLAVPVGGVRGLLVEGEADAALPGTTRQVTFLDARLDLPGDGAAAWARALERAVAGPGADPGAVAQRLAALEAGGALVVPLTGLGTGSALVTHLFQNAVGRSPDAAEMALHLGRLGSGVAAGQVAVDIALANPPATQPGGYWVPWTYGRDLPEDGATLATVPTAPAFALDLLIG